MSGQSDHPSRPQLEAQAWNRAGVSRAYAYELMSAMPPAFPHPVKIGKASRWVSAEIDAWIAGRIATRDLRLGQRSGHAVAGA